MTELQHVSHGGTNFTGAAYAIRRLGLPVVLDLVKGGKLRVYRIPGLPGKYFACTDVERLDNQD